MNFYEYKDVFIDIGIPSDYDKAKEYMKKIIINGKVYTKKYISGVQRYTLELINALDKLCDKNEIEICVPKCAKDIPNFQNIKVKKYSNLKGKLWEQISFPIYVKK